MITKTAASCQMISKKPPIQLSIRPSAIAGHDGARDVAQPADDHQGEGLEDQELAHVGRDELDRRDGGARQPAEAGRQHHGVARHDARPDADHQGSLAVLGDGAHGAAELGVAQHEIEAAEGGERRRRRR